jgi:muramoyltetrapeptide carboxypeptidase
MMQKPKALSKGGVIALIRPAGHIDEAKVQKAAEALRSEGYFVVLHPEKQKKFFTLAASDEARAREWMWAFTQPGIDCVWACRGGYGSQRILPYLKLNALKKAKARIFVGYSDLTFMHHWHFNVLKRVSFHGPLLGHLDKAAIRKALAEIDGLPQKPEAQTWSEARVIRSGGARGILMGGNLSLLQTSGPAALPHQNMILAIEDVREDYYRLDRMVWNLIHAGYSKWVRGIIVGSLEACGERDRQVFPIRLLQESLKKLSSGPIWWGARFGHGLKNQRVLALGCRVSMRGRSLRYEESAVR